MSTNQKFRKLVLTQYRHPSFREERVWLGQRKPRAELGTFRLTPTGIETVMDPAIYSTEDVIWVHSSSRFKKLSDDSLRRYASSKRMLYRNAAMVELIHRNKYATKFSRQELK